MIKNYLNINKLVFTIDLREFVNRGSMDEKEINHKKADNFCFCNFLCR